MQIDMHYYGMYALARTAGMTTEAARVVATASQFVDEAVEKGLTESINGSAIYRSASAHHWNSIENIKKNDQRFVWIPFHFLPGGIGDSFTEKLICTKDGIIAKEVISNLLNQTDQDFFLELLGITAHVYADTFAHYGFSGVSSRMNKILGMTLQPKVNNPEIKKHIEEKLDHFLRTFNFNIENIKGQAAEIASGALGHGSVATFPDRPYLSWEFEYEKPRHPELNLNKRDNHKTFLEGCQKIFKLFKAVLSLRPDLKDSKAKEIQFNEIGSSINEILAFEGKKTERIQRWQQSFAKHELVEWTESMIPEPLTDEWKNIINTLEGTDFNDPSKDSVYKFYKAANYHRNLVLDELLPRHKIFVV